MLRSLKTRLALLAVLTALCAAVPVSLVLIEDHARETEALLIGSLSQQADIKQGQLADHLEMLGKTVALHAGLPATADYLRAGTGEADVRLWIQAVQNTYWGMVHHVFLVDMDGTVVFSPERSGTESTDHLGQSVADSPFFEAAKQGPVITDFFGFSERDHYHQLLFRPVVAEGVTLGVVAAEVCIDYLDTVFREGLTGKGIDIFLITQTGEPVVSAKADRKPPHANAALAQAMKAGRFVGKTDGLSGKQVYAVFLHDAQWPWALCLEQDVGAVQARIAASRKKGLQAALVVLVLAALAGIAVAARTSKPVLDINTRLLASAEANDLTTQLPVSRLTEVGRLAEGMNGFLHNIKGLVGAAKDTSSVLAGTGKALDDAAGRLHGLSDRLEEKYTAVAGVSDTIGGRAHELVDQTQGAQGMVRAVNDATDEMGRHLTQVNALAAESDQLVAHTEEAMHRLREAVGRIAQSNTAGSEARAQMLDKMNQTRDIMGRLDESSRSVDKITRVIEKLADQTSLLALNATIEAEKAGLSGRSFAVVALDIKNLAGQSRESATRINAQITEMQENAGQVGQAIRELFEAMTRLHTLGEEISAGMAHQHETIEEVTDIVMRESGHLRRITEGVGEAAGGVTTVCDRLGSLEAYLTEVDGTAGTSSRLTEEARRHLEEMGGVCRELGEVAARVTADSRDMTSRLQRLDTLLAPYRT